MNHRKSVHPTKKKCRNFPDACVYGNTCWYVHEEDLMDLDESINNIFKCHICEKSFNSKNEFMTHKKAEHSSSVSICLKGENCFRKNNGCWFRHENSKKEGNSKHKVSSSQDFQMASQKFPPDQLKQLIDLVGKLSSKMEEMEQRIKKN